MPIQTSFNAGEFSDLLDGAVDLQKRAFSVKTLKNMIGLKQGPAVRRGPTIFVKEVKDSAKRTALTKFEFSDSQSYTIEIGDSYFRFYKEYAQIESGGAAIEVATPYTQANLFDSNNLLQLQFAQSGDVLYIVSPNYRPHVLTRTSDISWTLSEIDIEDGPYLPINSTSVTFALSGTTGSVTVTASSATFASTDVGRLIRFKDPANNWTWLEITAYTSATQVTALIRGANASLGTATVNWRLGVWSDTTGWPRAISFFQDRLALAGNAAYPDRYDLTKTGGYSSTDLIFQPTNAAGTVADDNAITGSVPSGQVNPIQWLASDLRGLVAGTSKEEFVIRANSLGDSITPSNATASLFSGVGSAYIQPVRTVQGTTFCQSARRRLFDVIYSFEQDSLRPQDLTLAAEHITRNQVVSMTYQQEPVNVIWAVRGDGVLIGMTHYPDQEVYGWHRHVIGGVNAQVEAVTSIPAPNGSRDDLWLIVKRTINGTTKRYVEYMERYYEDDMDVMDAGQVDCRHTYNGVSTSVVTGLSALEGETVKIMVDGRSHPDLVVSGGQITLANNRSGEIIHVGLGYEWQVITQRHESKSNSYDTAQGKTKRISNVTVRLLNTLGMSYGDPTKTLVEHDFEQGQVYDTNESLFSGDTKKLVWPGVSDTDGQMEFSSDSVFPACIIAIMSEVKVQA